MRRDLARRPLGSRCERLRRRQRLAEELFNCPDYWKRKAETTSNENQYQQANQAKDQNGSKHHPQIPICNGLNSLHSINPRAPILVPHTSIPPPSSVQALLVPPYPVQSSKHQLIPNPPRSRSFNIPPIRGILKHMPPGRLAGGERKIYGRAVLCEAEPPRRPPAPRRPLSRWDPLRDWYA